MTELLRPELFDPERHDRRAFDCGDDSLNQWFQQYAGQNRRRNTAATWVIAQPDGVVAAYATLSMTGIDRSEAPAPLGKQAPDPVPALLCGRLAVDRRYASLGVGTALVGHLLATAVELNHKAACKAVIVAALHGNARAWWLRFGFEPLDPTDPDCFDLYLLTVDIEATLDRFS